LIEQKNLIEYKHGHHGQKTFKALSSIFPLREGEGTKIV